MPSEDARQGMYLSNFAIIKQLKTGGEGVVWLGKEAKYLYVHMRFCYQNFSENI